MIPEELVWRGPTVHQSVGYDRGRVAHRDSDRVFRLLQDEHVALVVADQELQVQFDAQIAAEDRHQTIQTILLHLVHFALFE